MKNKGKLRERQRSSIRLNIATNLVLGTLILSVGAVCIAPINAVSATEGESEEIYRSASENTGSVSLMFNVYWGTEEVYKILDTLKGYEAKATFFIGGCWADDNVQCLKAIHEAGHEIGNHGYFHKDHKKLSIAENRKEISSCNQFIELALGVKIALFAPPSGSYGNDMLTACKELGMKTVLWSRDTIDWRDKNASVIYTRATKNIKGGEFVLMHPMVETAEALPDILKYYETQNLTAITVSENLKRNEKG